ncbi:MAG TPA: S4 domain-containing protein, partial [Planctomycetota bacterium]|nr:S4 domain-containing protein [Planctomycetota bacterium]
MNAAVSDDLPAARPGVSAFRVVAEEADRGRRLDVVLADRLPGRSRTLLKKTVKAGKVLVDGAPAKPSHKVEPGQVLVGEV